MSVNKIKCVHHDGPIGYFIPELAYDKNFQKSSGYYPDENQDETDPEALALAEIFKNNFQAKEEKPKKLDGSKLTPEDEANQKIVDDLLNQNREENERIDREEQELRGSAEGDIKDFPLEINEDDADDDENSPETIQGKKEEEPAKEEPRERPRQRQRR